MAVVRPLLAALLLVVIVAACGGGTPGEPTDQTPKGLDPTEAPSEAAEPSAAPPPEADASEAAGADAPATADVAAEGFDFQPATIAVAAGGMVTWTNQDGAGHTVSAGTPEAPELDVFDQPLPADGGTVTRTFEEPGSYPYFCNIHASMTGEVVVG
jgi:plastocyanin